MRLTGFAVPSTMRTTSWKLYVVTTLLLLTVALGVSRILQLGYRATLLQESINLRNISTAFATQTLAATRAIDQILFQAQSEFTHIGPGQRLRFEYLKSGYPAQAYISGVYIVDFKGNVIAGSGPANAATDHAFHNLSTAVKNSAGLSVSVSDVDESSGRAILNFSRPLLDDKGNLRGSVIARVRSDYFQRIYSSVQLGKGGSVTLMSRDGTMLVRGPSLPGVIGHSFWTTPLFQKYLPQSDRGVFQTLSPVAGVERVFGYDTTEDYSLIVITGLDRDVALSTWYSRLYSSIFFLGVISAAVIFLVWRLSRDAAKQTALIQQLTKSENRISRSAAYLKATLNTLATPVWVLDTRRCLVLLNDAFANFAGKRMEDLLGKPESEVLGAERELERGELYIRVMQGERNVSTETEIRDGNGSTHTFIQLTSSLADQEGGTQLVNVLTDISERKRAERRLAYLADFDLLTELPNHAQFRRVLREKIGESTASGTRLAVFAISLERLQEIIDLAGHEACDDALRHAADLLRQQFTARTCCIARVKSNEFSAIVPYGGDIYPVQSFAGELLQMLSNPVTVAGRDYYFGPVIGIALFPQDGIDADELLRRADIAKHRASMENLDPIHFVFDSAHKALEEQLSIETQLRRGLDRNEFRLAYQPKVDILSGRITGFEALLRWHNGQLGEIPPSQFIPVAERTGLIIPIGAWALREACREFQSWRIRLPRPVKVSVNLSLRQFHQKDLILMISRSLEESQLPADCLELEVTESTAMGRAELVDALLREIRALGVSLSIDDFGTGYSSLAYLKRFPVEALKIDRVFVQELGRDEDSASIVRSIVSLGHSLKLRIVAEGVESEEQLEFLRELSCDEFQGFLCSQPLDAVAAFRLLEANWNQMKAVAEQWPRAEPAPRAQNSGQLRPKA